MAASAIYVFKLFLMSRKQVRKPVGYYGSPRMFYQKPLNYL